MQHHSLPSPSNVSHRLSHGNLHINVAGEFALPHVSAVHGLLERHFADCKRVFIDVRDVEGLTPLAQVHFKAVMPRLAPDPHKIFFKGKTGFDCDSFFRLIVGKGPCLIKYTSKAEWLISRTKRERSG